MSCVWSKKKIAKIACAEVKKSITNQINVCTDDRVVCFAAVRFKRVSNDLFEAIK